MHCRAFGTSSVLSDANKSINVAFIGAGGVSFGTAEGPWNHSVRLEKMPNVRFTAIVDPNLELAQVWVTWHDLNMADVNGSSCLSSSELFVNLSCKSLCGTILLN